MPTIEAARDAALAELVYHRADTDQALTLRDILGEEWIPVEVLQDKQDALGRQSLQ